MARPLRIEYEGAFYHVTARGNERRKIFQSERDYQKFLSNLKEAIQKYNVVLHAYVLMGNHYHFLVETPEANLSAFMQTINSAYTTYFNIKRKRAGHLLQGRYKAILIDADSYLLELSRYIHLNPVRAGMVTNPEDYPYSSYRAYTTEKSDPVVTREKIWSMIAPVGRRPRQRYEEFVKSGMRQELISPLENIYGGIILGSKEFVRNTLGRIKDEGLQQKDIAHRRALSGAASIGDIIRHLSEHFKVPEEKIIASAPYKAYAVYLARKCTAKKNADIGQRFGVSYSAVTKIGTRLKKRMEKDRKLEREIKRIEERVSRVKV